PLTGSTWTRRGCNPTPSNPTSSCGRHVNLNPVRCFTSAVSSTIIFNLKTLNDERYGTFQTDYQGILGRQGTDGRTFRRLLCQRKQKLGRLYHIHSQSSQGKRLLRNDRRRGVVARHSLL